MISYDVIKSILRTEKGTMLETKGKYLFQVASKANKIQIRHAVEEIYKVKVSDVNVSIMPGKSKRVRQAYGYTPDWKRAIVTLKTGQKIDIV